MKFCFLQISNNLINPPQGSVAEEFYDALWQEKHKDGYWRPEHFWELPQWVAEICYTLPDDVWRAFRVVEEQDENFVPDPDGVYCFSVLDVNINIVKYIIENNQQANFVLGGYIDFDKNGFAEYANVSCFESIKDFAVYYDFPYQYGMDYSLFAGTKCIPRLTLSTGCRHKCSFCIVPDEVQENTRHDIMQQVESFRALKFKLAYINDKTFGQAGNHWYLKVIYHRIKRYNPAFEGFIVQTTAIMAASKDIYFWEKHHIKVVEIGVETYNDELLSRYRKPSREFRIEQAVNKLYVADVKIILNLILGLPGETDITYAKTYSRIKTWQERFRQPYSLNIYTLAIYGDSEIGKEIIGDTSDTDKDELATDRTFWTPQERRDFELWSIAFYRLGVNIIKT